MRVIAYHACQKGFADDLESGRKNVDAWRLSKNDYDWLGHGIYFWEGSLRRARQWAAEMGVTAVIEAKIELLECLDLLNFEQPGLFGIVYATLAQVYASRGWVMPTNAGRDGKLRKLDCLVINEFISLMRNYAGLEYQTVRCAFEEGEPIFPGSMIREKTHIQLAVRDASCITVLNVYEA